MAVEVLRESLKKRVEGYSEIRYHKRQTFNISVKDGKIDTLNSGAVEGACARVLVDGSWGFASTTTLEKGKVAKMLKDAASLARSSK
ncbi:MAG: DNA gyrase modulator, partial [Candidatus Bathyarchaeia archaeon]